METNVIEKTSKIKTLRRKKNVIEKRHRKTSRKKRKKTSRNKRDGNTRYRKKHQI